MIRYLLPLALACSCAYEQTDEEPVLSPGFDLLRSSPEPGQTQIPKQPLIDLFFNQAPDAESVAAADIRLFSGLIETLGQTRVDLLRRSIRFIPSSPLRANLQHQVYLNETIRGVNGHRLGRAITFSFITGTKDRTPGDPAASVSIKDLQGIWNDRCASGCHDSAQGRAGVDLSTPEAAISSLRGVPSRGWHLPRVVAEDHSRSYLMLKLLGEGSFTGFAMPPAGDPLPREQMRQIADWIDGGAR